MAIPCWVVVSDLLRKNSGIPDHPLGCSDAGVWGLSGSFFLGRLFPIFFPIPVTVFACPLNLLNLNSNFKFKIIIQKSGDFELLKEIVNI